MSCPSLFYAANRLATVARASRDTCPPSAIVVTEGKMSDGTTLLRSASCMACCKAGGCGPC
ncbi:hypothetical protein A4X06_0g7547, partial [Tilletia controversa]